jgi:hypothetical protein
MGVAKIRGESPRLQARMANVSTWRGLSLYNDPGTNFSGIDYQPFATLLADTDSIRSTDPYTFGGITVAAGSAGVVPTGMAGYWRLAAGGNFSDAGGSGHVEFDIVVNNFSPFWYSSFSDLGAGLPDTFQLNVGPLVMELAEGDVVWCDVFPTSGDVGSAAVTFLMEYLGPV